jgi:hypothetical protein
MYNRQAVFAENYENPTSNLDVATGKEIVPLETGSIHFTGFADRPHLVPISAGAGL